jgi:hypothetical protein
MSWERKEDWRRKGCWVGKSALPASGEFFTDGRQVHGVVASQKGVVVGVAHFMGVIFIPPQGAAKEAESEFRTGRLFIIFEAFKDEALILEINQFLSVSLNR